MPIIANHRRFPRGYNKEKALVNRLLLNMVGKADFVTVSGKVNNSTNPEKLYRRCGFQGNDVWHIIMKQG